MKKPIDPAWIQGDIDAFLDTLLQEQVNARFAAAQLRGNLDQDEWLRCFASDDPADQGLRSQLLFPFANGFNCLNEILRRASWIKYGHEPDPPEDMKAVYRALRQDGAFKSPTEKALARLNSTARNAMTHRYPRADPVELRLAILEFDSMQAQLRADLHAWLVKQGYRLLPD